MKTPQPITDHRTQRLDAFAAVDAVPLAVPVGEDATIPTALPVAEARGTSVPMVGQYEILGELGRGGMGVVYQARQQGLERLVALKMLLDVDHAGDEALMRFRLEAAAVARLRHPNIVQIFEVGVSEGRPFFSLEYVDGGTLAQRIAGQPQPPRESAALVETLAGAVEHAHEQGIVHRDLKPANVLLSGAGDGPFGLPKIADFGLAKHLGDDASRTRSGAILGTPSYVAPEQAAGRKDVGTRADVYALGAILYELLTGRPPFRGETAMDTMLLVISAEVTPPAQLGVRVPRDLETICLKCLQKDPARRYASAAALADDLRCFRTGESIAARPIGAVERLGRWCRRRPLVAALLALVVLLGASGVAGVAWQWRRTEAQLDRAEQERRRAEDALAEAQRERDRAEANFAQTRTVVDEFFTRISENTLLNTPGLQPLRRDLLQSAVRYYQDFEKQHGRDPALRATLADNYFRLGVVLNVIGTKEEALAAFRRARGRYEALAAADPGNRMHRRGLAACDLAIGQMHNDRGESAAAIEPLSAARRQLVELLHAEPTNARFVDDMILCCIFLANVQQKLARANEGLRTAEEGKELAERQVRELATAERRYRLLLMCKQCSDLHSESGRPTEADTLSQRAIGLAEQLVRDYPTQMGYRDSLAMLYIDLGVRHLHRGKPAEALVLVEKGLPLIEKLAQENPSIVAYQATGARGASLLGQVRLQLHQPDAALPVLTQACDQWRKLVAAQPTIPSHQEGLAVTCLFLGKCQLQTGQRAEAGRTWTEARTVSEALARAQPDNGRPPELLAEAQRLLRANGFR